MYRNHEQMKFFAASFSDKIMLNLDMFSSLRKTLDYEQVEEHSVCHCEMERHCQSYARCFKVIIWGIQSPKPPQQLHDIPLS